jgi:hypothetical protein
MLGNRITRPLIDLGECFVAKPMLRDHAEELYVARLGGGFEVPKQLGANTFTVGWFAV